MNLFTVVPTFEFTDLSQKEYTFTGPDFPMFFNSRSDAFNSLKQGSHAILEVEITDPSMLDILNWMLHGITTKTLKVNILRVVFINFYGE